jgi:hypothetical protein
MTTTLTVDPAAIVTAFEEGRDDASIAAARCPSPFVCTTSPPPMPTRPDATEGAHPLAVASQIRPHTTGTAGTPSLSQPWATHLG